jgi:hypothetical protein
LDVCFAARRTSASGRTQIAGLATLFVFDRWLSGQEWLVYVAAVPAFLLLQTFAEGALEVLWGAGRRLAPIVSALILFGVYVVWFAQL